jgi:hypothetical protein
MIEKSEIDILLIILIVYIAFQNIIQIFIECNIQVANATLVNNKD